MCFASQANYAYDKSQREKCSQRGITMPLVLLKEANQDLSVCVARAMNIIGLGMFFGALAFKLKTIENKKYSNLNVQATERMLVDMNKQWSVKNPCDRVAILMVNAAEKVEQRRFWAGRNWNVNVEPAEMVKLYQKEVRSTDCAKWKFGGKIMEESNQKMEIKWFSAANSKFYNKLFFFEIFPLFAFFLPQRMIAS